MFRSFRIRRKLAIALLIPLVALVVSSSLVITATNRRSQDATAVVAAADDVGAQVELVTAALGPSGILTALNDERIAESMVLVGVDPKALGASSEAETRGVTDEALDQFRTTIAAKPEAVRGTYQPALDALAQVPQIRARIDASTDRTMANAPDGAVAFDDYTGLVRAVFDANTRAANAVDDPGLRAGVRFIDQLLRYYDEFAVMERTLGGAIVLSQAQTLTQDVPAAMDAGASRRVLADMRNDMERNENPYYADLARTMFAAPAMVHGEELLDNALAGRPIDLASLFGSTDAVDVFAGVLTRAAERLQADVDAIRSAANAEADAATREASLVIGGTIAVLALAVVVTVVASRSITRPLARLVGAAEEMADQALPAAVKQILDTPLGEDVEMPELVEIDDRGGAEISEMAGALNTVQRRAAGLAVEQAALRRNIADAFVNLGRRNQNLLARLIEVLTEMKQVDVDPDTTQRLGKVDRFVNHMRRNAESLVVLAGAERRRQWSAPVPVLDVIQGAFSEVENAERVEIVGLDETWISGNTASEATHLVAELLENALLYSPPRRSVEIRGRVRPDGYHLAITDYGMGMEPEELAVANSRLAGTESFTVAPSRYLGHYVVGHQAVRLGVEVTLRETLGGGVTAIINLSGVLAGPDEVERAKNQPGPRPTTATQTTPTTGRIADEAPVKATATMSSAEGSGPSGRAPVPGMCAPGDGAPVTRGTTKSGYKRRVRGAHIPATGVQTAREAGDGAPRAPTGVEGMRAVLNSVQAGMTRAHAETDDTSGDNTPSEER